MFIVQHENTSASRLDIAPSGSERSGVLPFRFLFRDGLEKIGKEFGVGELLDLLELQASVFVSDDVSDPDHFVVHVHPE